MTTVFLRAGELDRRIKLQSRSAVVDSFGQQQTTWVDVASVWANIKPLTGTELVAASAVNNETTHQIVIRYRVGITAAMRATYGTRIFNIQTVIEPEMAHVSLQLLCIEGMNNG